MPDDEADQTPDQSPDQSKAPDELRDKFKAALERKHGQGGPGAAGTTGDPTAKASARTSNSKRQREFRRKSGG
ncbi:MAG TPA: DUF5302 domain-containing protein [Actinomycetes bacterium]